MKFELVGGNHYGPMSADGKKASRKYVKGDIVDFHDDLCALFPNKFKRRKDLEMAASGAKLPAEAAPIDTKPSRRKIAAAKVQEDKPAEDDLVNPLGEDVTTEFPKAAGKLKVFRAEDGKYNVAEDGVPNDKLNDSALNKKELEKFIKSLV